MIMIMAHKENISEHLDMQQIELGKKLTIGQFLTIRSVMYLFFIWGSVKILVLGFSSVLRE